MFVDAQVVKLAKQLDTTLTKYGLAESRGQKVVAARLLKKAESIYKVLKPLSEHVERNKYVR